MKPFSLLILALMLTACGSAGATSDPEPGPPGVHIDSTLEPYLQKAFDEVKQCAGIEKGEYKDLSIDFMPPKFICGNYGDGCQGQFNPPNFILLSTATLWKHEILHYLIHLQTGSPDKEHQSTLFKECA